MVHCTALIDVLRDTRHLLADHLTLVALATMPIIVVMANTDGCGGKHMGIDAVRWAMDMDGDIDMDPNGGALDKRSHGPSQRKSSRRSQRF